MEQRLPPATEAALYRIIQEALTNVARHARATTCRVSIRRTPGRVVVSVEDDGVGLAVGQNGSPVVDQPGLGLISIRERASLLRGVVRMESGPGRGTRLVVELPTADRPAADETAPFQELAGV
jgi:two-component system sensor histidine kinase UhpB